MDILEQTHAILELIEFVWMWMNSNANYEVIVVMVVI